MAAVTKEFVVGTQFPSWFTEQASKGRARINYNEEDGTLVDITVYTPTKNYVARLGDKIMLLKSGMTVLPKAAAAKFSTQPQRKGE